MARERNTLTWSVVTHDIQHWHPGWLAAADPELARDLLEVV